MADSKLSALTETTTLTTNDELLVNDGGTSKRITYESLLALLDLIYQALDADLTAIAALAKTDGNIIVGNGSTWVAESGATARASLGLTIGTDVQAFDADILKADTADTLAAGFGMTASASTDASFAPDFQASNLFTWNYTGNKTLANPTNKTAGGWTIIVASTTGTLSFGADYTTVSGGYVASKVNIITIISDGTTCYLYFAQAP